MPAIADRIRRIEKALGQRGEGPLLVLRPGDAHAAVLRTHATTGRPMVYLRYLPSELRGGDLAVPPAGLVPADHPDRTRVVGLVLRASQTILITFKPRKEIGHVPVGQLQDEDDEDPQGDGGEGQGQWGE